MSFSIGNAWNAAKNWVSDHFGPTSSAAYYGRADAITGAQPASGSSYPANARLYGDASYSDSGYVAPSHSPGSGIESAAKALLDSGSGSGSGSGGSGGSGGYYASDPGSYAPDTVELNYPNAALAQLYGMDAETAYQEALANTAIQRRMLDYKNAGLNPVLAAHYNSGADSFSGTALSAVSGGSYGSSGGSGYTPTSAGNGTSAKGFSDLMKSSDYRSALAAVASAGTMMVTKNFQLGAAAYYGVKGYLNSKYGYKR